MGTQTPELKIIDLYSIYFGAPKTFHIFGTCPIVEGEGRKEGQLENEGGKEEKKAIERGQLPRVSTSQNTCPGNVDFV